MVLHMPLIDISPNYLGYLIKTETGNTPFELLQSRVIEEAKLS